MPKTLHHLVPNQISSYVNQEYPLFVDFLAGYYEWLESEGNPYRHLSLHLSYLDLKETIDAYANHLKNEFLHSLPDTIAADKRLLINYSKQFFRTIGTEKSFKFIFKTLYEQDVELYYPKNDILRVSDGKWVDDEVLLYASNSGNVDDFLYRRIEQKREVSPGYFEYAYATVQRIIKRYANKFNFTELYVVDVEGEFDTDYPIGVDDRYEWILPICEEFAITEAGSNYGTDNRLTYTGPSTFDIEVVASDPLIIDTRYTTLLVPEELTVEVDGVVVTDFAYSGKMLEHPSIVSGSIVKISFPVYAGLCVVDEVNETGGISSVKIIDTPFGITSLAPYIASEGGSGGVVSAIPSVSRSLPGYYLSTDGFLSSDKKLQDSQYYQEYSYVIRSGIDVDKYRDVVLSVLHPAGMLMIGEVNIVEFITGLLRNVVITIDVRNVRDISLTHDQVALYSRYSQIDDFKFLLSQSTYKVWHFRHLSPQDILDNMNQHFNINDTWIRLFVGDYVDVGYVDLDYIAVDIVE